MNTIHEIVIVSNFKEPEALTEDTLLAQALRDQMDCTMMNFSTFVDTAWRRDVAYLIRNVWGRGGILDMDFERLYEALDAERVIYRNTHNGKGDQKGKNYLVALSQQRADVVPTFDSLEEALRYQAAVYVLKPVFGSSGKGVVRVARGDLSRYELGGRFLLQPLLDVLHEVSFFFIKKSFQYSLRTKARRWDLERHTPDVEELRLAQEFNEWNSIEGIQRVDFIYTASGRRFLLELEDWCPYLSLFTVPGLPRAPFIDSLLGLL
ncbi:MAG: hypothetical protein JWM87_1083 [Candidatus Eremiobacteraeota bacterium]|nr:hypothetical protein [Candidatus Eremiobacteraeota bacterium]